MSVETLLLKRRRALYTNDSSTVICAGQNDAWWQILILSWTHACIANPFRPCLYHSSRHRTKQHSRN